MMLKGYFGGILDLLVAAPEMQHRGPLAAMAAAEPTSA